MFCFVVFYKERVGLLRETAAFAAIATACTSEVGSVRRQTVFLQQNPEIDTCNRYQRTLRTLEMRNKNEKAQHNNITYKKVQFFFPEDTSYDVSDLFFVSTM